MHSNGPKNVSLDLSYRLTRPEDMHLPTYDFTTFTAVTTCPTWGVLRYIKGKKFADSGRALALECGAAMHEAFSAVRLVQLGQTQGKLQHMLHHGDRLFGKHRWPKLLATFNPDETPRNNALRMAMTALDTSGYEDDPYDKYRTLSNMTESLIAYVDAWDFDAAPIFVANEDDPTTPVGIEIIFDIVVSFKFSLSVWTSTIRHVMQPPEGCVEFVDDEVVVSFRFVGRIDGLHWHNIAGTLSLYCHENKTASRINEAWRLGYVLTHQVTGYCVAATLFSGIEVSDAFILGLQIPLPKNYIDGLEVLPLQRDTASIERWVTWLWTTLEVMWRYCDSPIDAPKFTHSCNRYFRPCAFMAFCQGDREDQEAMLEEMVDDYWTPLREVTVGGDDG
jgi:hypothetical protein